jgi:hypothetical protein
MFLLLFWHDTFLEVIEKYYQIATISWTAVTAPNTSVSIAVCFSAAFSIKLFSRNWNFWSLTFREQVMIVGQWEVLALNTAERSRDLLI